ncbi:hypothetical protein HanIR_Chr17g0865611 [Helianthus annuus]|nr:hypothetical protein HanIR_Chr17g0865611 [Helianthus annuus]
MALGTTCYNFIRYFVMTTSAIFLPHDFFYIPLRVQLHLNERVDSMFVAFPSRYVKFSFSRLLIEHKLR